jgi:TPR repeat protein
MAAPEIRLAFKTTTLPVQVSVLIERCSLFQRNARLLAAPTYPVRSDVPTPAFIGFVNWLLRKPHSVTAATVSGLEQLSTEFGADDLLAECRAFRANMGDSTLLSRISALEERQRGLERYCQVGLVDDEISKQVALLMRRLEALEIRLDAEQHYRRGAEYFYGTNGYGHRGADLSQRLGLAEMKAAANLGHADAQYVCGRVLREGPGRGYEDRAESTRYMKLSADQGNCYGEMGYGRALHFGYGVQKNIDQAFVYYERAAARGNARGQNGCGYCFEEGQGVRKDHARAVTYYRQGAEQGNAGAMNNYGCCLRDGVGVQRDEVSGCDYIKQAADHRDPNAMNNFAMCLENGKGIARDIAAAADWYKFAADSGLLGARADYERVSAILKKRGK